MYSSVSLVAGFSTLQMGLLIIINIICCGYYCCYLYTNERNMTKGAKIETCSQWIIFRQFLGKRLDTGERMIPPETF